ncbi:MAG: ABC transporter permease [Bacillota bacterium]|nr:ABC transporter permease [Bacillota bacterium]
MTASDWNAIYVIWLREIKRYWREKPRVITSVFQPILWLFIMGVGIGSSINTVNSEQSYLQFIFPGIISMTLLFSAMNSGISIVWDKEFGFMREILVSPVRRGAIIVGKMLAGSSIAMVQGIVVLCFAPIIGISLSPVIGLLTVLKMFVVALSLSTIGIFIGCRVGSFHSYPLISNFIIMPMFFLSGAMFSLDIVPLWMIWLSRINPMSYGVDFIRQGLMPTGGSVKLDLVILLLTALIMAAAASRVLNKPE